MENVCPLLCARIPWVNHIDDNSIKIITRLEEREADDGDINIFIRIRIRRLLYFHVKSPQREWTFSLVRRQTGWDGDKNIGCEFKACRRHRDRHQNTIQYRVTMASQYVNMSI